MTKVVRIIAGFVAIGFVLPLFAFAAEFRVGEQPSFSSGATLANDLYMAGGTVTSAGVLRGDLSLVGGTVLMSGPVSADLIVLGGNITITGAVGDDVRVAGGNITIQGRVTDDVLAGGGQVHVGGDGVGGDLVVGGGVVRVEAPVGGDIRVAGGDIYINSTVKGSIYAKAEKIRLGPDAIITGNFSYSSPEPAVIEEGAVVRGETNFTKSPDVKGAAEASIAALFSLWFIAKFLMTFVGALIIAFVLPRYAYKLLHIAADEPLFETGRGLVFFVTVPIASILLIATIIGAPFGLVGLFAFFGMLIFASIISPIIIGSIAHYWVFKPSEYQLSWKTILLGAVIYSILPLVPLVGWLAKLIIILLAIGAALNIKIQILREWR